MLVAILVAEVRNGCNHQLDVKSCDLDTLIDRRDALFQIELDPDASACKTAVRRC